MPDHASAAADPTAPHPKRFYWLKRFAVAALVLAVLLVGLRLVWGHRVQARLDQTIADIQAKGEPILFEDLQSDPIDDADNAAWHLMQALQNWPSVPGQPGVNIHNTDWYIKGEEAGFTDPITDNTAYLVLCEPVLDTIRTAVAMDQARWFSGPMPADYNSFTTNIFGRLGDTRRLARLMEDAARRAFDSGDTALGFEILKLIGQHGDQVGLQRMSLIDALVAISIHLLQFEAVRVQLPLLTDEQVREPATRQALIALRDWLIDESPARETFVQSLITNRWGTHHYVLGIREGTVASNPWIGSGYGRLIGDTPGLSHVLNPLLVKAHADALSLETEAIAFFRAADNLRDALGDPNEPTFEEIYEARPWLYPIFEELFFSDAAGRTYYRNLATRRMTATAIAIRLYQADHHGQRTSTLDALVPQYLPAVPMDPYVGDKTIGYKPHGVVPITASEASGYGESLSVTERAAMQFRPFPLLYCVGGSFDDNGGKIVINSYDGTFEYHNFGSDEGEDHWYLLVPEPEPVQALIDRYEAEYDSCLDPSERGEDEVEEEDDAGDDAEDEQPDPEPGHGQ